MRITFDNEYSDDLIEKAIGMAVETGKTVALGTLFTQQGVFHTAAVLEDVVGKITFNVDDLVFPDGTVVTTPIKWMH